MSRKHFIHVLKFPDGRFLRQHTDYADQFTTDPLSASNMTVYTYEDDTNEYKDRGAILVQYEITAVQYEITATPTGVTCADIFKEERARIAEHTKERAHAEHLAEVMRKAREDAEERLLAKTLGIDHAE